MGGRAGWVESGPWADAYLHQLGNMAELQIHGAAVQPRVSEVLRGQKFMTRNPMATPTAPKQDLLTSPQLQPLRLSTSYSAIRIAQACLFDGARVLSEKGRCQWEGAGAVAAWSLLLLRKLWQRCS
jgi:hypothetical protein